MAVDDWGKEPEVDDALELADVIAGLAHQGDPIPTGFPPVDRVLRRGGFPPGRLLAIIGPPGAGKTILCTMMLNAMSARLPTLGLFADEGRDEAAIKLGQQLGYEQETLERGGSPGLIERIRERLAGTFLLPDPEAPQASIRRAVERLATFGPEGAKNKLLILDSIQTIRLTPNQEDSPDTREAITAATYAFRSQLKRRQWLGIVTAQAQREHYRAKKTADQTHPLAAAAGSRAIEFASDFCLVFGIPDDEDVVKVWITKNRLGKKGIFYLKLDRVRASLIEVDENAMQESERLEAEKLAKGRREKLYGPIERELARSPGLTRGQLGEALPGRKQDLLGALAELEDAGRITSTRIGARKSKVYDLPAAAPRLVR
jgi:predicted ATP-dependent serine protease